MGTGVALWPNDEQTTQSAGDAISGDACVEANGAVDGDGCRARRWGFVEAAGGRRRRSGLQGVRSVRTERRDQIDGAD
nr:hypothetical protein CFP56_41432 [Quercus suber]